MTASSLNLLKLCVGTETVEELLDWQARRMAERGVATATHVTRMWPKRGAELIAGGSLYWVFKGFVRARQPILGFEPREGADGVRRCAILLGPEVVRTAAQPRRPFQGWRYLRGADAPRDLGGADAPAGLPPALLAGLDAMGVL